MGTDEEKATAAKDVADTGYVKGQKHGEEGDFEYYPLTEQEKRGYEFGLEKWLKSVDIRGVDPAEIATPVTLKGFFYTLARQGMLKLDNCPFKPDSKEAEEYIEAYIRDVLAKFDETIINFPQYGDKVEEWKANFEKGLQIAASYLDKNFKAFCNGRAEMLYGLDVGGMSEPIQRRYFELHKSIQGDLASMVTENPFSITVEYMDILMRLYDDKIYEIYGLLDSGDKERALQVCDYLELLVQYTKRNEDDLRSLLEHKHDDDYKLHFDEEPLYHIEQLNTYGTDEKMDEIPRLRRSIVRRMGDAVLDYQERIRSYARQERYEEAGRLKEEFAAYRRCMDSINQWLLKALPEFRHMI